MNERMRARIQNAIAADDHTLGAAIAAAKGNSQMPRRDEATRLKKLNALYSLQGDARAALSMEFQRIDRRHYTINGIAYVEHRREVELAIKDWL